jgi:hypothetical protein
MLAQVEDFQALVADSQRAGLKDAAAVGSAREHDAVHSRHRLNRRLTAIEANFTADAAHKKILCRYYWLSA